MSDTITVSSIADFSRLIDERLCDDKKTTVLYRGHGAQSFKLQPKVGRQAPPMNSSAGAVNEELMLELFRRQSVGLLEVSPQSDWEFLAIAQHHGMSTRLLDWTRSPLVALYFSVCKECETRDKDGRPGCEDAEVLAWRCAKEKLAEPPGCGPLKLESVVRYIPRITTSRLRAQSGLFTVHPRPTEVWEPEGKLLRVRIPSERRKALKDSLFRHGVHESVLFPELDGLARHIDWLQTKCY
jgi:hypothetical protein